MSNPQRPMDYTMRYQRLSGRVNFANYVVQKTQVNIGEKVWASYYFPTKDASIVPNLEEGATYTTPAEEASYIAEVIPPTSSTTDLPVTEEVTLSFTSVGSTTWTAPAGTTSVEYLLVGGGGGSGGGYDTGGGGGGGGGIVLTGTYSVSAGNTYTIVVGDGGVGGISNRLDPSNETNGSPGQDTVFDTLTALGGGGGYGSRLPLGGNNSSGGPGAISPNVASEGGRGGGSAGDGNGAGGGGGGNTTNGSNGVANVGGNGGGGVSSSLSGSSLTYGIGGRGANGNVTAGNTAVAGTANTGNGARGGGTASSAQTNGAKGGSGIVILKYTKYV